MSKPSSNGIVLLILLLLISSLYLGTYVKINNAEPLMNDGFIKMVNDMKKFDRLMLRSVNKFNYIFRYGRSLETFYKYSHRYNWDSIILVNEFSDLNYLSKFEMINDLLKIYNTIWFTDMDGIMQKCDVGKFINKNFSFNMQKQGWLCSCSVIINRSEFTYKFFQEMMENKHSAQMENMTKDQNFFASYVYSELYNKIFILDKKHNNYHSGVKRLLAQKSTTHFSFDINDCNIENSVWERDIPSAFVHLGTINWNNSQYRSLRESANSWNYDELGVIRCLMNINGSWIDCKDKILGR